MTTKMLSKPVTEFPEAMSTEKFQEALMNPNNMLFKMALKKMLQEKHPAINVNRTDKKHPVIEICGHDAGMDDGQVLLDIMLMMQKIIRAFEFKYGRGHGTFGNKNEKTFNGVLRGLSERSQDNKVRRYESKKNGDDIILNEDEETED